MREIVLDTETTGLSPQEGHRIVEIGCVELMNTMPTGKVFHVYLNPERDVPKEAEAVHGLSNEFLKDKPKFAEIAKDLEAFIAGDALVIHNAAFDLNFLDFEMQKVGSQPLSRLKVTDTLLLARRKHAGQSNSLDALCNRYGIDLSGREKHGALLDSELLAHVYIELLGGRQTKLELSNSERTPKTEASKISVQTETALNKKRGQREVPLASRLTDEDKERHSAYVQTLGQNPVWLKYAEK